jgi:hypothetical protein
VGTWINGEYSSRSILIQILQSPSLYLGSFRMTDVVEFRVISTLQLWSKTLN